MEAGARPAVDAGDRRTLEDPYALFERNPAQPEGEPARLQGGDRGLEDPRDVDRRATEPRRLVGVDRPEGIGAETIG